MTSPAGWVEPGQTPEFDEYTVVLDGEIEVRHRDGMVRVAAGEAIITPAGEWVQYATPKGAQYVAVCLPAFSPDSVQPRRVTRSGQGASPSSASISAIASHGSTKCTACSPNSRAASMLSTLSSTKIASPGFTPRRSHVSS